MHVNRATVGLAFDNLCYLTLTSHNKQPGVGQFTIFNNFVF